MHTAAGASNQAPFRVIPPFEISVFEKVSQQQLVDQVSRQIQADKQQQPELESEWQGQGPPIKAHDVISGWLIGNHALQNPAQQLRDKIDGSSPSSLGSNDGLIFTFKRSRVSRRSQVKAPRLCLSVRACKMHVANNVESGSGCRTWKFSATQLLEHLCGNLYFVVQP